MKKKHSNGPLASCVKSSLDQYFKQLNGSKPNDIYSMVINEIERPLLEIVMQQARNNRCKAAEILGINRNTLRKKLKQHGLDE